VRRPPVWLHATLLLLLCMLGLGTWLSMTTDEEGAPGHREQALSGPGDVTPTPLSPKLTYEDFQLAPSLREMTGKRNQARAPSKGIAIIMDDVGYDLKQVRRVLALPFPVALSIMPDAPHARESAEMANSNGRIVMLHMPMQPVSQLSSAKTSEGFLRADMRRPEVRRLISGALGKVPYVSGINNHMGSLLTSMAMPMRWVMEICRQQGLFFVDSRTSKETVAAEQARLAGIGWGERRVFLDHNPDPEDLETAWKLAKRYLARDGYCIVILHPHAETLDFLEHRISEFDKRQIVSVTDLLHQGQET